MHNPYRLNYNRDEYTKIWLMTYFTYCGQCKQHICCHESNCNNKLCMKLCSIAVVISEQPGKMYRKKMSSNNGGNLFWTSKVYDSIPSRNYLSHFTITTSCCCSYNPHTLMIDSLTRHPIYLIYLLFFAIKKTRRKKNMENRNLYTL